MIVTIKKEDGSVTMWTAATTVGMLLIAGMAYDFGCQLEMSQRAMNVADQASRAGAQRVVSPSVVAGKGLSYDLTGAVQSANQVISNSGMRGQAYVRGQKLMIDVDADYRPTFLALAGITQMPVSAHSEASAQRLIEGNPK